MTRLQAGQPFVLERNVGCLGRSCAACRELLPELVQKRSLAGPAHTDNRRRLARKPQPS